MGTAVGQKLLPVQIINDYLEDTSLPEENFDLVWSSEVVEHVPDVYAFCAAMARYVKPEGIVCLTTPNAEVIRGEPAENEWRQSYSPGWHLNLFTARSLELVLRRSGFADVFICHTDGSTGSKRLVAVAGRSGKLPAMPALQALEGKARRLLVQYAAGEKERRGAAGNHDVLYWALAFRLVEEFVNAGDSDKAAPLVSEIDAEILGRGLTREKLLAVRARSLPELLKQVPAFTGRYYYLRGMQHLRHEAHYKAAAEAFEVAAHLCQLKENLPDGSAECSECTEYSRLAVYHKGIALLQAGKRVEAMETFDELLTEEGRTSLILKARSFYQRGVANLQLGNNRQAAQDFFLALATPGEIEEPGAPGLAEVVRQLLTAVSQEWLGNGGAPEAARQALASLHAERGKPLEARTEALRQLLQASGIAVDRGRIREILSWIASLDPAHLSRSLIALRRGLGAVEALTAGSQEMAGAAQSLARQLERAQESWPDITRHGQNFERRLGDLAGAVRGIQAALDRLTNIVTLPKRLIVRLLVAGRAALRRGRAALLALLAQKRGVTHDLLLITPDTLGTMRIGLGMRHWEIAQALADQGLKVTLASAHSVPEDLRPPSFEVMGFAGDVQAAVRLARKHRAILVQGDILNRFPLHWLKLRGKEILVDMACPFHIENIQFSQKGFTRSLRIVTRALRHGSFFICGNESQRLYWLGMLTSLRRLHKGLRDQEPEFRSLIDVVGFGTSAEEPTKRRQVLKGVHPSIKPGDFVLLWFGGIWNWLDPLPLVRAVHQAHEVDRRIKLFFSMLRRHDSGPPEMAVRAYDLAEELGALDRSVIFNELPIPYDDRADYLLEADLGVVLQATNLETQLSARTRALDYIWAGLPLLTNDGDEIAALIRRENLGVVTRSSAVEELTAAILEYARDPERQRRTRENVQAACERFRWTEVTRPIVNFLRGPGDAPPPHALSLPVEDIVAAG